MCVGSNRFAILLPSIHFRDYVVSVPFTPLKGIFMNGWETCRIPFEVLILVLFTFLFFFAISADLVYVPLEPLTVFVVVSRSTSLKKITARWCALETSWRLWVRRDFWRNSTLFFLAPSHASSYKGGHLTKDQNIPLIKIWWTFKPLQIFTSLCNALLRKPALTYK